MEHDLGHSLTRLARDQLLRVRNVRGMCLVVFHGMAWVTQEGDSRDRLLTSGESFTFDRQGVALIHAMEATSLVVLDGDATHSIAVADAQVRLQRTHPWQTRRHSYRRAQRLRAVTLARAWRWLRAWAARLAARTQDILADAQAAREATRSLRIGRQDIRRAA